MPSLPTVAVPGQPLAHITEYLPGSGIHIRSDGQLCASIVGIVQLSTKPSPPPPPPPPTTTTQSTKPKNPETKENPNSLDNNNNKSILSVHNSPQSLIPATQPILPEVSSQVLARITRITHRQATASIIAINDVVTIDEYPAVIRVQDIRATEKDKVKVGKSFRPGDIVRAQVISLGDREGYYLSTAGNYLGVVLGWSEDGGLLYPKSWREMACSRTGSIEERKVAKPL